MYHVALSSVLRSLRTSDGYHSLIPLCNLLSVCNYKQAHAYLHCGVELAALLLLSILLGLTAMKHANTHSVLSVGLGWVRGLFAGIETQYKPTKKERQKKKCHKTYSTLH